MLRQGSSVDTLLIHCCCTVLAAALQLLEEVQAIFQIYDDDGSGTLDTEEFVHAMEHTGAVECYHVHVMEHTGGTGCRFMVCAGYCYHYCLCQSLLRTVTRCGMLDVHVRPAPMLVHVQG